MENTLFTATIVPPKEAPDGDTSSEIVVTEEVNAFIVWYSSYDAEDQILKYFHRWSPGSVGYIKKKSEAIVFAVEEYLRRTREYAEAKLQSATK